MRATTIFLTVHKGASTFIASEFAFSLEKVFPELEVTNLGNEIIAGKSFEDVALRPEGSAIIRMYPQDVDRVVEIPAPSGGRFSDKKIVVLRRDPRDAAISLYYSKVFSHSSQVRDPEKLLREREELGEIGVYEGVLQKTARAAMREFNLMSDFIDECPWALVTTYEKLVTDYATWLEGVAEYLGWDIAQTQDLYDRTKVSFDPPDVEDPNQHKRRITPGNWQEIHTPELQRLYERLGGERLEQAGYRWDLQKTGVNQ
ncbi:MAG: sulfotransferase domain-containing protein [Acidimicrobiales bacterium]